MLADIATAFTAIKTLTEFAALVAKSKTDAALTQKAIELNMVIIDLQNSILSIQAQDQDLLRRNNELKQKIVDIENWTATAEKYDLKEIALGVFVYVNKKNDDMAEPTHWLCAHCYEDKKKSILQREGKKSPNGYVFSCGRCKNQIACYPGWFGNKEA